MGQYNIAVQTVEDGANNKLVQLLLSLPDGDLVVCAAMNADVARKVAEHLTLAADKSSSKVITFGPNTPGMVIPS